MCIRGEKNNTQTHSLLERKKVPLHTVCVCHRRTTIRNRRTTTYSIKYGSVVYTFYMCTYTFEIDEYYFYMYAHRDVYGMKTPDSHTHARQCARNKKAQNKPEWEWERSGKHLWKIKSHRCRLHVHSYMYTVALCVCALFRYDVWSLCTCCRADKKMHDILICLPMLIPRVRMNSIRF